jgi:hypothetical protein
VVHAIRSASEDIVQGIKLEWDKRVERAYLMYFLQMNGSMSHTSTQVDMEISRGSSAQYFGEGEVEGI